MRPSPLSPRPHSPSPSSRRLAFAFVFAFSHLAPTACRTPDEEPAAHSARDSAGITIVENAAPAWSDAEAWTVSDFPSLVIGTRDGPPETQLFRVRAATRFPDGRIAVANDGTAEVRTFHPDGRHDRTIGRRGSGPGEFQSVMALDIEGDTLIVHDHREVERFALDGTYLDGSYGVPPGLLSAIGEGYWNFSSRPLWDGSWLFTALPRQTTEPPLWELHRNPLVFMRLDPRDERLDTLAILRWVEQFFIMHDGDRALGRPLFPNMSRSVIAWEARRVFMGDPAPPEVRVFRPDSAWIYIRWSPPGRKLSKEDLAWDRGRREDQAATMEQRAAAAWRNLRIRSLDRVPPPRLAPAFIELVAGTAGDLWVKEHPRPGWITDRWRVFDPAGRELGVVHLEKGLHPLEIGPDYLLALHRDELGIERVRLHEIHKPNAPQGSL